MPGVVICLLPQHRAVYHDMPGIVTHWVLRHARYCSMSDVLQHAWYRDMPGITTCWVLCQISRNVLGISMYQLS